MITLLLVLLLSQDGKSFQVKEQAEKGKEDTPLVHSIKEKFIVNSLSGQFCSFSVGTGMSASSGTWETYTFDNVLEESFMCTLTLFPTDPKKSPENVVGIFSPNTLVYRDAGNFTISDPAGKRSLVLIQGNQMPSAKMFLPAMMTFQSNPKFIGRFRMVLMTVPTAFHLTARKLPQQTTMNPAAVKTLIGSQQFTSLVINSGSCILKQCSIVQATVKSINLQAGEMLIVSLEGSTMSSQTVSIFGPTTTGGQSFVSKSSSGLAFYYFRNDDKGTAGNYRLVFSGK